MGDHDGSAVPTERVLQVTHKRWVSQHVSRLVMRVAVEGTREEVHLEQPSQLAVAVVDVFGAVLVAQRVDAVAQSQQGAVDVSALL